MAASVSALLLIVHIGTACGKTVVDEIDALNGGGRVTVHNCKNIGAILSGHMKPEPFPLHGLTGGAAVARLRRVPVLSMGSCDRFLHGTTKPMAASLSTVSTSTVSTSTVSTSSPSPPCAVNQNVVNHKCTTCPPGTYHEEGANPDVYANTACQDIICNTNYYVLNNVCQPCAMGYTNVGGDNAAGPSTYCDLTSCPQAGTHCPVAQTGITPCCNCAENEFVHNYKCTACPAGKTRPSGDNPNGHLVPGAVLANPSHPSKADTTCLNIACDGGFFVSSNVCQPCANGFWRGGDDPSGPDTVCDKCVEHKFVENNVCRYCAAGFTRPPGDDPTGPDTTCTPIICTVNQYVNNNLCQDCPTGKSRPAGDLASAGNTVCA